MNQSPIWYNGIPRSITATVYIAYWIIAAIREHIRSGDALAGACVAVGIDESVVRRVVIAGLEVIETGFVVIDIATVANRVAVDEGGGAGAVSRSGIGGDVAPGVVGIAAVPLLLIQSRCPVFQDAEDALHVALQIRRVEVWSEIGSAVLRVAHRKGLAGFIIDKVHDDGSVAVGEGFPHQLSVEGVVGVGHTVHCFLRADAVGIVGIGRRLAAYRHRG